MAKTFDTSRTGGGTYELALDANGNYNLNSVGFDQINKLNLPDLKTSDTTSVADTTKKATEDTIKAQTTEVFTPSNAYQSGEGGGGQDYATMPTVKEATVRSAGDTINTGKTTGKFLASGAAGGASLKTSVDPITGAGRSQSQKFQERFDPTKIQAAAVKPSIVEKATTGITSAVDSIKNNKAIQFASTALGFITNPVMGGIKMVAGMMPKMTAQQKRDQAYFAGNLNPADQGGRIAGNPATDVFAGMNAVSMFGDVNKGAQNRIDTRNSAKTQARMAKKGEDALAAFNAKTETFKNQIQKKNDSEKGALTAEAAAEPNTGMGSCFIAGTKVTMSDGTLKNIENIVVGDKVKGHKEDNTVIKLDPTLLADRKLYSFNDNEHYFFTSEHPFMTEEGWKSIKPEKTKERDGIELYKQLKGELKVGDKLVTDNGSVEIKNIKSKEISNPEMPLYNFNVSNDNSYIADDYVVHNKGCFIKGTLVTMADGSTKPVEQVDLGDEVAEGGSVFAVGRFLNTELYDYKGVKVSGSHMVNEDGTWMRVRDTKHGKSLGNDLNTVYVFGSENRRILINGILFTDYFEVNEQGKLIEDSENFFNNWKSYGNTIDEHNVNTLNGS